MTTARLHALVPAAGRGQRAGAGVPKQYHDVGGQPMLARTLRALAALPTLDTLLVVLDARDDAFDEAVGPDLRARCVAWRHGGASRAASVRAGLDGLAHEGAQDDDWVLVHDAARCLVEPAWVERLIDACCDDVVGGLLALPLADTMKRAADRGEGAVRSVGTAPRDDRWLAQTPQLFRLGLLRRALDAAGDTVTDEASAVERLGFAPRLVTGSAANLKVTWPDDFALAERLLRGRASTARHAASAAPARASPPATSLRIGEGWDIHALVVGRPLMLGGVEVPHTHGLLGHSDADALLHAITDACLGAAGLGDIGRHFPDTDPAFAGADSARLLQEATRRARSAGGVPVNVDATIVAQAPKLAPHIDRMRARVAALLGLEPSAVNVKAKTAERMDAVGRGEAIEARAVVLMAWSPPPGDQGVAAVA